MHSFSTIFIFSFLLSFILSCNPDKLDLINGCCANPAINTKVGNGHVYIPNIFTPDGDDLNDYFVVFGDSIRRIQSVVIKDEEGLIVFIRNEGFLNDPSLGWDGQVDGIVQEGIYEYTIVVEAEDGTLNILTGKVCNHPCEEGEKGPEIDSVYNCQFPAQVSNGQYHATISSGESNECFE